MAPADGAAVRFEPPLAGEPYLLTPGPLTTSASVKRAMLRDWGSWDGDFRAMTADLRRRLLAIAGDKSGAYDCVPMQGSGTFAVEAMLGTFLPRDGKALVLMNGAYGQRIAQTLDYLGRAYAVIDKGDYLPPRGAEVAARHRYPAALAEAMGILPAWHDLSGTLHVTTPDTQRALLAAMGLAAFLLAAGLLTLRTGVFARWTGIVALIGACLVGALIGSKLLTYPLEAWIAFWHEGALPTTRHAS